MTEKIKEKIRTIPDWPKKGIMFRDITTLLKDPVEFKRTIDLLADRYKDKKIDAVVGIESRGFIIGAALAYRLNIGFVPIRKTGKLPGATISEEYELEYRSDKIEIHEDSLGAGDDVIIVDDLIATGGTALAACKLVKKLGANVLECAFVIDLPDLGGKNILEKAGYKTFALVDFSGE